jgi:hypothetical protein
MATRTLARIFDSYADASAAVGELEAAGFLRDDISLISNRQATTADDGTVTETAPESGAGTGATIGAVIGGGAGLLAGLGALAIPGLGPVVAAGWLIATLTGAGVGAAAGGLLGALTNAGIDEEHAHVYAEGVRRGGTLVTLRTDETRATEAEAIMARHNAVDATTRGAEYRTSGWSRYDESSATDLGTAAGVGTTTAGSMMGTRTTPASRTDASLVGDTPDGTPGNPRGTMLSRGVDEVAGTNISGAHPENERSGSALGSRDGTPGNPPGTKVSRGMDQAAGTNVSGAYPGNETHSRGLGSSGLGSGAVGGAPDGTPGNPPGTKVSRGIDEAAGTNISGAHPENETPTTRTMTTSTTRTTRDPSR